MNILLNHQCPAAHTVPSDGPSYVEWYCILEKGHSGDHKDHRNRKWVNENNEGEADGGQAMNSELKKLVEKLKERAELSTVPYNDSWGKGATYGFLESVKEIEKVLAPQEAPPRLLSAPATPATKCTCGDSQNEDGCEYHGVQFYQRAEPAPAAPEVDLMEKWNARLGENCYFCRQHRMPCSEHKETRRCADELAAWLPAHDANIGYTYAASAMGLRDVEWKAALKKYLANEQIEKIVAEELVETDPRNVLILHDVKVRAEALEEYLKHTPAINLQGQITCCACGETTMGDFAWKRHIRALAEKEQP